MQCNKVMYSLFLFLVNLKEQNCARILAIVPSPFYSHQIAFQQIWVELALRGHKLTLLTTDPINNTSLKSLKEINLSFAYDLLNVKHNYSDMIKSAPDNLLKFFDRYVEMVDDVVDHELQHPEVKALIQNKTEHFDLLMLEFPYPSLTAFSERFKCPFIGLTSLDAHSSIYDVVGNPSHPVLNPDFSLPFGGSLTFTQRIISLLFQTYSRFYIRMYSYPKLDLQVKKHFGDGYPPLKEIATKVSLLFVNADPIFHNIRPLVPAVIQIGGGTHLKSPKALPHDVQKYLDTATKGFIYLSLGSNVKSVNISENLRNTFIETFTELPYKILWKYEDDNLPAKPNNVYIGKWFSQQDILRHPNIKLFITQGGLQSMEEAIYNYVPILGIPFYADQYSNVDQMVAKGFGLSLIHQNLNKKEFKKAILEVVLSAKYRENVKRLAKIALDQPMTGLQRAIWWTEYVLRHKGAKHLRSPAVDLPLYQYLLLDVIALLFVLTLICIRILILLFKMFVKFIRVCKKSKID